MTDEQINQRIAEACGWTELQNTMDGCYGLKSPTRGYIRIPDYCTDLNAMHEAEKTLDVSCRLNYPTKLLRVLFDLRGEFTWYGSGTFPHITATARQRAEAFLRTLGKWDDQSGERAEMEVQE